jgi:hypothetical protein
MSLTSVGANQPDSPKTGPTHEERLGWLKRARVLVQENRWDPIDPWRLDRCLRELGVFGDPDTRRALLDALEEIAPGDYRGAFPPDLSYEDGCKDAILCPFAWQSKSRACRMYLKFCFFEDRLKIVTFHRQREKTK